MAFGSAKPDLWAPDHTLCPHISRGAAYPAEQTVGVSNIFRWILAKHPWISAFAFLIQISQLEVGSPSRLDRYGVRLSCLQTWKTHHQAGPGSQSYQWLITTVLSNVTKIQHLRPVNPLISPARNQSPRQSALPKSWECPVLYPSCWGPLPSSRHQPSSSYT